MCGKYCFPIVSLIIYQLSILYKSFFNSSFVTAVDFDKSISIAGIPAFLIISAFLSSTWWVTKISTITGISKKAFLPLELKIQKFAGAECTDVVHAY